MASVRKEFVVDASPDDVWAAFRDVGAVHRRLLPGRVLETQLDGDARVLTFPNGGQVRELIVDIDDDVRRLAYAVVEGGQVRLRHHHASLQVFGEGEERSRVVWITDLLPHRLVHEVRTRVEVGSADMKRTLEANHTYEP